MSRSYKRAVFKDHGKYTYIDKRLASKAVRRATGLPDGMGYRRVYNSWNICDYIFDLRFRRSGRFLGRGAKRTGKGWMVPK